MEGELVPVVLIPRFTTYIGSSAFASLALEVERFSGGSVSLWRGPLIGTGSPTFTAFMETSEDGVDWVSQNGATGYSPGANGFLPVTLGTLGLPRRLFRIRVVLTGTGVAVTCWCAGSLVRRLA